MGRQQGSRSGLVLQQYRPPGRRHSRIPEVGIILVAVAIVAATLAWWPRSPKPAEKPAAAAPAPSPIRVASLFGGATRNGYPTGKAPSALRLKWKLNLGQGQTQRKPDNKLVLWKGSGWTGQPTVVEADGHTWLLLGAYDHKLHKIDAATGEVAWESKWPDVMKGTNTVVADPAAPSSAKRLIVVSGSRRGSDKSVGDPGIAPLRAVSFETGKELWRLPVPKTANYSQDVDSSPLWFKGALYCPVESGYVYKLDPFKTRVVDGVTQPVVLARSPRLYTAADVTAHPDAGGANLAIEASPSAAGERIYITSGSGHVYGLDRKTLKVVWDFRTGSDIDGTPVITHDGHLLVTIEKQYISEPAGVYELDPSKPPASAVVWYSPLPTRGISEWAGGSVGSAATNDHVNDGSRPRMAAFTGVDGSVRVISRDVMSDRTVNGPGPGGTAPVPREIFADAIGGSISTPVFAGNRMVAVGFDRKVHLYGFTFTAAQKTDSKALPSPDGRFWRVKTRELDSYATGGSIESVPLVYKGVVYVGCRDGYLYCLK
jgi:outer membrane protein assembly factor BamB